MKNNLTNIIKFVLIFLIFFLPFRELVSLYTYSFVKILPDILIYLLFVLVIFKNKFKLNLKKYDIFYICFLLIGLFSTFINQVSFISYLFQFRSITTMYVLFYVLRNSDLKTDDYKLVVKSLTIVCIVLVLFAIIEVVSNKCLLFPLEWAYEIGYKTNFVRAYSFINNPNTFALFLLFSMILYYYFNKDSNCRYSVIFYMLCFIGIFISSSRSAMLSVLFFMAYLFIDMIKKKNLKNFLMFLIIISLSFILTIVLNFLKEKINISGEASKILTVDCNNASSITNESDRIYCSKREELNKKEDYSIIENNVSNIQNNSNSTKDDLDPDNSKISVLDRWNEVVVGLTFENSMKNGRLFHIVKGIEILSDSPIYGTGFGTFGSSGSLMVIPKIYEKYNLYEGFYADNEYIKVIVETGLVGFIFYILFIFQLFKNYGKKIYAAMSFLIFLFVGLFYNIFEIQVLSFLFYIILIIININDKDCLKEEKK